MSNGPLYYTDTRGVRRERYVPAWTLHGTDVTPSAVALINELLPDAQAAGWGLGLTGSVLYSGESANDLDMIAYPMCKTGEGPSVIALGNVFWRHGFRGRWTVEEVHAHWREEGSLDTKHVEVWWTTDFLRRQAGYPPLGGAKRVDLFILR